jgi:DUF4097 and DUF4098 domain-containing protein YvlB
MRATGTILTLLAAFSLAHGAEQETRSHRFEVPLGKDGALEIANLLGSVEVIGGGRAGIATVEARVVAEAKEGASALADGVRVETREGATPAVVATFPIPESGQMALPRDPEQGALSRLMQRVFDRRTVEAEHEGRAVVLGRSRDASKIAVHLRIVVPHDGAVTIRQAAGSVLAARFRGDLTVETRGGSVRIEQLFGSAEVRTASASVEVASFQGESLTVESTDGEVRVIDALPRSVDLRNASGPVEARRVQAASLSVSTVDGEIALEEVDAASLDLRSESGAISLGTRMKGFRRGTVRTASGDVEVLVGGVTPFAVRATAPEGAVETDRLPELERIGREGTTLLLARGRNGAEIEIATETGTIRFDPF